MIFGAEVTSADVLGGLVGIISGMAATAFFVKGMERRLTPPSEATVQGRLEARANDLRMAARTLERASDSLRSVDAELADRQSFIEELEKRAELAALSEEQLAALSAYIGDELHDSERRTLRSSVLVALLSFIAGSGVTVLVSAIFAAR